MPAAPPGRQPVLELLRADPRFDPAIVAEIETRSAAEAERLRAGYAKRMALLLPALQAATAGLAPAADAAAEAAALEALADHVWVQVRGAQGWQDLDPEAQILGPIAAGEILDPAALPEELRHAVVLRVVLELQDAAGLREERLLEWQGHPPELLERGRRPGAPAAAHGHGRTELRRGRPPGAAGRGAGRRDRLGPRCCRSAGSW